MTAARRGGAFCPRIVNKPSVHSCAAQETGAVAVNSPRYVGLGGKHLSSKLLTRCRVRPRHTLADRGTRISFKNKGPPRVIIEGDPVLLNRYDVIELNPKTHAAAKPTPAHRLGVWLSTDPAQRAIDAYRLGGKRLFSPLGRQSEMRPTSDANSPNGGASPPTGASPNERANRDANTGASSASPTRSTSRPHPPDAS